MSESYKNPELQTNGWAAVPRSFKKSLAQVGQDEPAILAVQDVKLSDSEIFKKTYVFAKDQLPERTFNHCMRVVYYGNAIVHTHFPHLKPLLETYYLTCLLHDLDTTAENLHGTRMSFEFYGSVKAMNFLRENGASKDQAEAVGEAIIRHADLGETGTLTSLGMLIQLSTVFGELLFSSVMKLALHCQDRVVGSLRILSMCSDEPLAETFTACLVLHTAALFKHLETVLY